MLVPALLVFFAGWGSITTVMLIEGNEHQVQNERIIKNQEELKKIRYEQKYCKFPDYVDEIGTPIDYNTLPQYLITESISASLNCRKQNADKYCLEYFMVLSNGEYRYSCTLPLVYHGGDIK